MTDTEKRDRIRGMLWGLIVGDCLGSPVQFMEMDSFPKVTEMLPCHNFNTPAAQISRTKGFRMPILITPYLACSKMPRRRFPSSLHLKRAVSKSSPLIE